MPNPQHAALASALRGDNDPVLRDSFDSPRRVILQVTPTQRIGYDGPEMARATAEWTAAGHTADDTP